MENKTCIVCDLSTLEDVYQQCPCVQTERYKLCDEIHNTENDMGKVISESSDKLLNTMPGTRCHDL